MLLSKRTLIFSAAVLIFLSAAVLILIFGGYAKSVFGTEKNITVIIDAGHGTPDGGAVGIGGTLEKDINLAIALKTAEVLEGKGIRTVMTRTGDSSLYENEEASIREKKREDMNNRMSVMKNSGADVFISIHMNSFASRRASGLHVFYSDNHAEGRVLAEEIQKRISDITGAEAHTVKAADKGLFLMKNPPIPAILIECGFISNPDEEKKLNDEDYQSRIAWAIAEAAEEYLKII